MVKDVFANRIAKLKYGNGCQLHDNCFDCPIVPDCNCTARDHEGKKAVYIDVGKVFYEEGINYGFPSTDRCTP